MVRDFLEDLLAPRRRGGLNWIAHVSAVSDELVQALRIGLLGARIARRSRIDLALHSRWSIPPGLRRPLVVLGRLAKLSG